MNGKYVYEGIRDIMRSDKKVNGLYYVNCMNANVDNCMNANANVDNFFVRYAVLSRVLEDLLMGGQGVLVFVETSVPKKMLCISFPHRHSSIESYHSGHVI